MTYIWARIFDSVQGTFFTKICGNPEETGGQLKLTEFHENDYIACRTVFILSSTYTVHNTGISTWTYTSFQALFQPLFKGTVSRDFRYLQMILKDRTWVPSVPLKKNGILQFPINCSVVVEGGVVV